MSQSPNLSLPYILPAQAQKHVTHNEAIRALDAIVQLSIIDRTATTPPTSPTNGDRYIVASGATDDWDGKDNQIAAYQDGAWAYFPPTQGWLAYAQNEDALLSWSGTAWTTVTGAINPAYRVGVNAIADDTNRLSINSPASLFNHEGTDHRLTINKANDAATASVVFQNNFSGRSEFGLTGDNNFHMKVSPDGNSWKDALILDSASGEVGTPYAPSSHPNLIINGNFAINQRGFAGGTLANGTYGHDRWKAATANTDYTVSNNVVTLNDGTLEQVIEARLWGSETFSAGPMTISLDDPSADITVTLAGQTGTINAGTGRQSYTFATGPTGTTTTSLTISSASSSAVSFSKICLTQSSFQSEWAPRSLTEETQLASRYFQRIEKNKSSASPNPITIGTNGSAGLSALIETNAPMRAAPTLTTSAMGNFSVSIPGSGAQNPTAITLTDTDPANPLGPQHICLTIQHPDTTSTIGYLEPALSQTATLDLDAEL